MNKKLFFLLTCYIMIICISGCENGNNPNDRTAKTQNTVEDVIRSEIAKTDTPDDIIQNEEMTSEIEGVGDKDTSASADKIDIDLTAMSSTMVYSEVYNMMYEPDEYIGKTIKMNGTFKIYHDEDTGNNYFACIIQDATACCTQGIEFVPTNKYLYPDDYPYEDEEITVTGVFDTYMEGEYKF
ncbi:MAG: hypothetical protein IJ583_12270, partial [Firmicutes bacterium]|nr:hypothetical protein [Bacillota bacterium]